MALAVLGLVVAASVRSSSNAVANLSFLESRTMAHWVAMNRAAELQLAADLSQEWVELYPETGEVEMAGRIWYWKVSSAETRDKDVRRVDIEVRQSEDSEYPASSLSFFLGRPMKKNRA